ncbi:MAG TPA: hypothetical protein PL000_21930, partial [Anaerolineales bacterium]|nr:hypothetical protein [Anaerolineales bacterium]
MNLAIKIFQKQLTRVYNMCVSLNSYSTPPKVGNSAHPKVLVIRTTGWLYFTAGELYEHKNINDIQRPCPWG